MKKKYIACRWIYVVLALVLLPSMLVAQASQFVEQGWAILDGAFEDDDANLQALELFLRALEQNPRYDDAYHGLALTYFRMGNYAEAVRANQEALRLRRNYLPYKILEIRLRIQQHDFDAAATLLRAVLPDNPSNANLLLSQADIFYAEGRYDRASTIYQSILELDSYNMSALLSLTYIALYHDQGSDAADYITRLLERHSDDVLVLLLASRYYAEDDRIEESLFYAEQAYARAPLSEVVLTNLIQAYIQSGDFTNAVAFIDELLTVHPNNVLGWYGKGKIEQLGRNPDQAVKSYARALLLDPFFEPAILSREELLIDERVGIRLTSILQEYIQRADELQSNYQYVESELLLRRALRIDPYNTEIRKRIADIYELRREYPQYLNELEILQTLGDGSQQIADAIEGVQNFLDTSVAFEWNLPQFEVARPRIPIHIFYETGLGGSIPRESQLYAWLLEQTLFSVEQVAPVYHASPVTNIFTALQRVDNRGDAIVLIVRGGSNGAITAVDVDVFLGTSGAMMGSLRSVTSGRYPIEQAIMQIYRGIQDFVPRIGSVIQISGQRVLFTLGNVDGLDSDAELRVYQNGMLSLTVEPPYFTTQSPEIGRVTTEATDALISEGQFNSSDITRTINIGDLVVFQNEEILPTTQDTPNLIREFLNFRMLDNSLFIR